MYICIQLVTPRCKKNKKQVESFMASGLMPSSTKPHLYIFGGHSGKATSGTSGLGEIGYRYNLAQLDLTKLFKIKIWLVLSKATFLLSCRTLTLILQYDEVMTSALAGDVHGHGDRTE